MEELSKCNVCGETMPEGEQMFMYHGYSGPCPIPTNKSHEIGQSIKHAMNRANDEKSKCLCSALSCDCPLHAKDYL